jgi:hypothetical protein
MKSLDYDPKLSRKKPSKKYKELLNEYVEMHSSGKGMFDGKSLVKFIDIIHGFLQSNDCKTLLDYGAGKGTLYTKDYAKLVPELGKPLLKYWDLNIVDRYEPALPEFNKLPDKHYDAVICTDVLEHIPDTDIGWVVDEILDRADKIAFFNIACYPARKTFKDGTNVHISIYDPRAWVEFFVEKIKKYNDTSIYLFFDVMTENHKTITLEGFKIDHRPRVIQLKQQEVE